MKVRFHALMRRKPISRLMRLTGVLLLLPAWAGTAAAASVHPGLQHTRAELNVIKAKVNGTAPHPMKDGWAQMLASPRASLTYTPTPYATVHVVSSGTNAEEDALRNDGVAAYSHALQWVVTGDLQHAQKAIEIIDAWSEVFVEIVPAPGSYAVQDSLESDWYAPQWLNAAEILRHYGGSGWSAAGIQRFDDRMVQHFKVRALEWGGSTGCCPNQGVSAAYARMSIGVYLDDQATYDSGLNHFNGDAAREPPPPRREQRQIRALGHAHARRGQQQSRTVQTRDHVFAGHRPLFEALYQ